ncbi:MAG TPA: hypothetical protein VLD61_06775 [Methylomirabilota bacterium]|nr:hypothetical protein [Methylomirabilota bacterium]
MRIPQLTVVAALLLTLGPAWASDHSGTVLATDRKQGIIVIEEVGPWLAREGQAVVTRRALPVEPSAQFVMLRRASAPGPSGWPGDFVEMPLGAWAVKMGDFVTVRVERKGARAAATRITVTDMAE